MKTDVIILENTEDKLKYQEDIQSLFYTIFQKPMSYYENFFVATPLGNKIICYIDHGIVKGVGNVTRIHGFFNKQEYDYYLLTTSMIDESVRRDGAYFAILNTIKEVAMQDKVDFILAFPNTNAYPILTKLGGFQLKEKNAFSLLPLKQILSLSHQNISFSEKMLQWRLSFHQYYTHIESGYQIVYKLYNNLIDVLHVFDNQIRLPIPIRNFENREAFMFSKLETNIHQNTQPICMTFFPIMQNNISLQFSPILSDVF